MIHHWQMMSEAIDSAVTSVLTDFQIFYEKYIIENNDNILSSPNISRDVFMRFEK